MNKLIGPLMLLWMAVMSKILYGIIGSRVLEDGTLVEPFYLIGIGSIMMVVAGFWLLILGLQSLMRIKKYKVDEVR